MSAPNSKAGRRETRVLGTADLADFFRRPFGPGWALVGDARYHKDPLSAQGITDALQQAEMLAESLDAVFSGREQAELALSNYEQRRNTHSQALYEFTAQRASYEPPAGLDAGTVRCEDFFHPGNIHRILKSG